ncbi:MAG: hypothetical protein J6J13_02885 [Clostridia bacterium]|nr:hypothetical protein [Clostridia bacterium]
MRQNIRVDVIYYNCDTDFEMEFNLNGCCPMRMLTGSTPEKSGLVKSLAKAVSRSKIIICCGQLFGAEGLIEIVSASIGRDTMRVDCKEYGIVTASDISVIAGSVPLVTPDGYFGGCIIESGPQTIILVSENRTLRKTLMETLIHPYLEEISVQPDLAQKMSQNVEQTPHNEQNMPVDIGIDEEKAAADAAAIVAAALGEASVLGGAVADEMLDFISDSDEDEITPADVELELEQSFEEEVEEFVIESEEQVIEDEQPVEEEKDQSDVISMDADENDGLFVSQVEDEDIALESEDYLDTQLDEVEVFVEPRSADIEDMDAYAKNYIPSESDKMFLSEEDEYEYEDEQEYEHKQNEQTGGFSLKITITVLVVLLILIMLILGYILILNPYIKGVDFEQYIQELFGAANTSFIKRG